MRPLHVTTSAALREKRLAALLGGRDPRDFDLAHAVEEAQILGSLELAGIAATGDDVTRARRGDEVPAVSGLLRARATVETGAPFTVDALKRWHAAAVGGDGAFRSTARTRGESSLPPAPPGFVASRLGVLEQWMNVDSSRELQPAQAGALVLARIVEILPFDDGNGRVARLAASHLVVRAGGRPPILGAADRARLQEALAAAFQLATEPLAALLTEASDRCLDVMIRHLEA